MTKQIKVKTKRKEEPEMLEQLMKNITNGKSKTSNYYRMIQKEAYADMKRQHDWCNYYKNIKKEIIDSGLNIHPNKKVTIYNKKHKNVLFTKYTKVPKYRTYKQQLAITNKTEYRRLETDLVYKNILAAIKLFNRGLITREELGVKIALICKQHDITNEQIKAITFALRRSYNTNACGLTYPIVELDYIAYNVALEYHTIKIRK
jgi:hypothetical protein